MNELIKLTLDNRGYTPDDIYAINNASHDTLKDIGALCFELYRAKSEGKHIVILPDFDMDGIMSGTLGFAGLSELGFRVSLFIPSSTDGYGFTKKTAESLIAQYPDVDVILTCDVGTTCFEGVATFKEHGIQVLVTNHHDQEKVDENIDCIVNPMRIDETYAHPQICGAYVLWQVLDYYTNMYESSHAKSQIDRLRVFAGIGTVSDCMPLLYENRQLVKDTVDILNLVYSNGNDDMLKYIPGCDIYKRVFRGLYTLLHGMSNGKDIDESFLGFYLAPAFNAVKRLDGDMAKAFGVFFYSDMQSCVDYLIDTNNKRKQVVEAYYNEIQTTEQPLAPYIYLSSAPKGIMGLLATKCLNDTGLPSIVVNQFGEAFEGSARSPEWYPALSIVRSQGVRVGGHEHAFGIHFDDAAGARSLFDFLAVDVDNVFAEVSSDMSSEFVPDFTIAFDGTGDTNIDIDLFDDYLDELVRYKPFGKGFNEPAVMLKFHPGHGEWSAMGATKTHLNIKFAFGFKAIVWGAADQIDVRAGQDGYCYIVGQLSRNSFRNVDSIQFIGSFTNVNEKICEVSV